MIRFKNGHSMEFFTASGAMGYDGKGWLWEKPLRWLGLLDISLFAHITKTITLQPRKGNFKWLNPFGCLRPIWRNGKIVGAVNASGLTNPGFEWWTQKIGRKIDSSKIQIIASIFGELRELSIMATLLNAFNLVALEINASCPNTQDDALSDPDKIIKSCEAVKDRTRHPIILKLSVANDVEKIVPETEKMVQAYDINSVPWRVIFPDRKSPLAKYGGGGVSGKIAQPFTWALAEKIKSITEVPVIAPSLWDYQDLEILRKKGFKAFSFGSVHLWFPCRPTSAVREDNAHYYSNHMAF